MEIKPLVVIVGPTASGKTSLAVDIAEQYGGEIICADSRTVYRDMNIGTAKPDDSERIRVPHWGLDLCRPDERFNASEFKQYAVDKIAEIRSHGNIPFLVGGTGLYIDAIIFDYQFGDKSNEIFRQKLESMSLEELLNYCVQNNVQLPENDKNKRYVIRAIEQKSINNKRSTHPIDNTIVVGIATNRDDLRTRIVDRSEQLFKNGVVDEAKKLGDIYGWNIESMTGNIYPLCKKYIDGDMTFDQLKQKSATQDWRLAKRQLTWLRRNKYIKWGSIEDSRKYLSSLLASEQ